MYCSPNAISPKGEPGVEASLPRTLLEKRSCAHPKHKETSVLPMQFPTPTNIPSLSKALETTPSTSVRGDGHNTEQSRSARRIPTRVPNFPILTERPLLLTLRLKLPGNVAHGDHTQHVHSARPHTMASLPAHPGPAETPSSTLLIAKIGKTCHVSVQRSVQHDLKHCVL